MTTLAQLHAQAENDAITASNTREHATDAAMGLRHAFNDIIHEAENNALFGTSTSIERMEAELAEVKAKIERAIAANRVANVSARKAREYPDRMVACFNARGARA